jgi:uncharacterized membrane protein
MPGAVRPWGSAAGLLAACVVTLVGILRGLDPEVILVRAIGTAVMLGALISIASCLMSRWVRSS